VKRARKTIFLLLTLAVMMGAGGALIRLMHTSEPPEQLNRQELLNKDLITAIYDENAVGVITLLKKGANPSARGYWDRDGRWDEARHQRVWEPSRNTGGPTALMLAVFSGRIQTVRALLAQGIDVNARDKGGNTALMYAGLYGEKEAAYLLLDHGAEAQPNDGGEDPLEYFVEFGDPSLVRRMLAHGSKINGHDPMGETPLIQAASLADAPMVRFLLKEGAEVDARDNEGETALLRAVTADDGGGDRIRISPAQQSDTVRALLDNSADVTLRGKAGRTALEFAIDHALSEIVALLKKAGAKA